MRSQEGLSTPNSCCPPGYVPGSSCNVANDLRRFHVQNIRDTENIFILLHILHINYSKGAVRATIYLLAYNTFNLINITDSLN
jgi:hypothetical protein